MLTLDDSLRQMQGLALDLWGFGPSECSYRVVASGKGWRLREYAEGEGEGPPLLIVAAPIKRPYIWDIAPPVSVIRCCLEHRFPVYLLEWTIPSYRDANAGLGDYALRSIGEAVTQVSSAVAGARPFLIGHSLGGTFAAIFAAFDPTRVAGLVLVSAPLSFAAGTSSFRDALVALAPAFLPTLDVVPGSLISQLSVAAAPETFVWSRVIDAGQSLSDAFAVELHLRVERWALDEFPLPGRLVREVLEWLYRENRFCAGSLPIAGKLIGASSLYCPTLMVVNTADAIVPPPSVAQFIELMPPGCAQLVEYPGEVGVALQHLAVLIGRQAHASVWPKIAAWLRAQGGRPASRVLAAGRE
jgi:polyhydroxyalkanoate synthase subunit PhaC